MSLLTVKAQLNTIVFCLLLKKIISGSSFPHFHTGTNFGITKLTHPFLKKNFYLGVYRLSIAFVKHINKKKF